MFGACTLGDISRWKYFKGDILGRYFKLHLGRYIKVIYWFPAGFHNYFSKPPPPSTFLFFCNIFLILRTDELFYNLSSKTSNLAQNGWTHLFCYYSFVFKNFKSERTNTSLLLLFLCLQKLQIRTDEHISQFARLGLRTLVLGHKIITQVKPTQCSMNFTINWNATKEDWLKCIDRIC